VGFFFGSSVKADTHIKCGFAEPNVLLKAQRKALANRPERQNDYLTSDQRFLLHYDVSGMHAIDTTSTIVPGTPDWLIIADRALHCSWHLLVDSLGFMPPPMDSVSYADDPPGGAYDIYFTDFSFYGMTYPENLVLSTSRLQDYTGYMTIENDFQGYPTEGIPALQVTLAHEFFHLIHLGYAYKTGASGFNVEDLWWYELSSTWFENVAYPDVDDYLNYAPQYFNFPKALDETTGYDVGQYGEVLSSYHKPLLMESIWQDFIDNSAYASIDMGLSSKAGLSFADSYQKFAGWNLITGSRSVSGEGFADAEKLPEIATEISTVILDSTDFRQEVDTRNILYYRIQTTLPDEQLFAVKFSPVNTDVRCVISPNANPGSLIKLSKNNTGKIETQQRGEVGLLAIANGGQSSSNFALQFQREFFSIYPNPLIVGKNTELHILTAADVYKPEIRFYDIRGREVLQSTFTATQSGSSNSIITLSIPIKSSGLSRLSSGVYFLRIEGKNTTHTRRITILK